MTSDWEKFESDFKKQQSKLKKVALADGEKIKKRLKDNLKAAWAQEDKLREMIVTARTDGIKGDKPGDFAGHKGYGAALSAWKKAVAAHRSQVKEIERFCKQASAIHAPWSKRHADMKKSIKKSKETAAEKKKKAATMKRSEALVAELKQAADLFGTLKVPEVFYALKLARTEEKILEEALKKSKVGEMPAIFDETERNKSLRLAKKMLGSIEHRCDTATELAGKDKRKAQKALKMADGEIKKLAALSEQYQSALKEKSKEVDAAKNKKFILDTAKRIRACHDVALEFRAKAAKAGG